MGKLYDKDYPLYLVVFCDQGTYYLMGIYSVEEDALTRQDKIGQECEMTKDDFGVYYGKYGKTLYIIGGDFGDMDEYL